MDNMTFTSAIHKIGQFLLLFVLAHSYGSPCNQESCSLPDCYCPGTSGPAIIERSQLPQMIMLTMDDSVNQELKKVYDSIFKPSRRNPNGCPIVGTFYVSNNWTDYKLVSDLKERGHEMASHSLTHQLPQSYWTHLMYEGWKKEMNGQRKRMSTEASIAIDEIRGLRVPFLELGGDEQFRMMRDAGFLYDATFMTGPHPNGGAWPFTLDNPPSTDYCSNNNCPKRSWPGIWELPLNRWINQVEGQSCAMVDSCETQPAGGDQALSYFWHNFNRFYRGNKAPLGIHLHATWFTKNSDYLEAFNSFIDSVLKMKDVYFVTAYQVIEWMKDPQAISKAVYFKPWMTSCDHSNSAAQDKDADSEGSNIEGLSSYQPSLSSADQETDYKQLNFASKNKHKVTDEADEKQNYREGFKKQYDYTYLVDNSKHSSAYRGASQSPKLRRSPFSEDLMDDNYKLIGNKNLYDDKPYIENEHDLYRRGLLGGGDKKKSGGGLLGGLLGGDQDKQEPVDPPASERGLLGGLLGGGKKTGQQEGHSSETERSSSGRGLGGLLGGSGGDRSDQEEPAKSGGGLLGGLLGGGDDGPQQEDSPSKSSGLLGGLLGGGDRPGQEEPAKSGGGLLGGLLGGDDRVEEGGSESNVRGETKGTGGGLLGLSGRGDGGGLLGGLGGALGGVAGGVKDLAGGVVSVVNKTGSGLVGVVGKTGDLVGDLGKGVVVGVGSLVNGTVSGLGLKKEETESQLAQSTASSNRDAYAYRFSLIFYSAVAVLFIPLASSLRG